jgi:hypothetical protein
MTEPFDKYDNAFCNMLNQYLTLQGMGHNHIDDILDCTTHLLCMLQEKGIYDPSHH